MCVCWGGGLCERVCEVCVWGEEGGCVRGCVRCGGWRSGFHLVGVYGTCMTVACGVGGWVSCVRVAWEEGLCVRSGHMRVRLCVSEGTWCEDVYAFGGNMCAGVWETWSFVRSVLLPV